MTCQHHIKFIKCGVLEVINSIPDGTFSAKQVGEEISISSNNAGNILQMLHDKELVGRKRTTEIITVGNIPLSHLVSAIFM